MDRPRGLVDPWGSPVRTHEVTKITFFHYRTVEREILLNLFGISYKYYYKPSPLSSTAYTSVLPCVILTAATSFFYPISARRRHHYHNLSTSTCRSACLQRLRHSRLRLLACIQSTRSPSVNFDTDWRTLLFQVKLADCKVSIYSAPTLPRPFTNIMVPCLSSQVQSDPMDKVLSDCRSLLTNFPHDVARFLLERAPLGSRRGESIRTP